MGQRLHDLARRCAATTLLNRPEDTAVRSFNSLFVCLTLVLATGCGTQVEIVEPLPDGTSAMGYRVGEITVVGADVPDEFVRDLRAFLEDDLDANGLLGAYSGARHVDIVIGEFDMPTRGSLQRLGATAGRDLISTDIRVRDADGLLLATSTVRSIDPMISPEPKSFTNTHARAIARLLSGQG